MKSINTRRPPRKRQHGTFAHCYAYALAAALEEATGTNIDPDDVWDYALEKGWAKEGKGVYPKYRSRLAYAFAPKTDYIPNVRVGDYLPYIAAGNESRVGWFYSVLKNGTLILTKESHALYVYGIEPTKRPWILRWLGEYKHEFLAFDPAKGQRIRINVDSMSQRVVDFIKSPLR